LRTIFIKMAKNKNEETGVILKIQKQTGCLLFVIGAAMLAFVLTDFFKSGSSIVGGSENVVGEIAGEEIGYNDFMEGVEELKVLYQGSNIDEPAIREQAWNKIIQDKIIKKEHRLLGLETGKAEIQDALFGPNPDPLVTRNFTDPNSGQFDANRLRQFIEIDMQEDEVKYQNYLNFLEGPLKETREGQKYEALVTAGIYTTALDAKYEHDKNEFKVGAVAVGLPYIGISDSTVTYDDSDLQKFLNEHSEDYQQTATRDIDFVVLNVFPAAADTLETRKWVAETAEKFKNARVDSSFLANYRSLRQFNPEFMRKGTLGLSADIEDAIFQLDSGEMTDVIYANGVFGAYKVVNIKDDSVAVMRARHILVLKGDDAMSKARGIMSDLKSGASNFEDLAVNNPDQTSQLKGDLGWFLKEGQGIVTPEVRERVFASSVGNIFVVESDQYVHVVEVTGAPSRKLVQFGALERRVTPGMDTDREVERQAGEIQYLAEENTNFADVVEGQGQRVREATNITLSNPSIPGVRDAKEIARWLFNDKTKVGDLSEVISLEDRYIIAKCVAIREEGTAALDDNREKIEADYINDQKGDVLMEQLKTALASSSDAKEVAAAVNSIDNLIPVVSFVSQQVPGIGAEPDVIGAVLGLEQGDHSVPIKGTNGVYVIWNTGQVNAGDPVPFNEPIMKSRITEQIVGTTGDAVLGALRLKGEIVDKRYNFF
jgi:peptidyl-prolyl cis-trans isomerase D